MSQNNVDRLTKDNIYKTVEKQALEKGFSLKTLDTGSGAEKGFIIFNNQSKIYGNIMSNTNEKEIYQGITLKLYNFFESNNAKNFIRKS